MAHIFKILSPTTILGYGFLEEGFRKAVEESSDLVAVDAGLSDPGPHYLRAGKLFTGRAGVRRDLRHMIAVGVKNNIPAVIGTAGGSGAAPYLEWYRWVIHETVQEEKLSFSMALIPSDVDREIVHQAPDNGKTTALDFVSELTHEVIEESTYIVAQVGIEPFQRTLKAGAQVVLGGRVYDPACLAALPIMQGFDEGPALRCSKILECAAITATPGSGSDCAIGIIDDNGFTLKVFNPKRKFTEASAAAHTLYEESDPYFLPGPGGVLNLKTCTFTQVNGGEVYVSGSRHEEAPYALKLEGVRQVDFRCLTTAGIHDPIMVAGIDTVLEEVQVSVARNLSLNDDGIRMMFYLYGKNGVMDNHEPMKTTGHELGILLDVVAPTQDIANSICSLVRSTLLHYSYENRITTVGNLAFPFSPSDIQNGPVYGFSIYHLIEASNVLHFDFHIEQVTPGGVQA